MLPELPSTVSKSKDVSFTKILPIDLLLNYPSIKENAGIGVPRAARVGLSSSNFSKVNT